MHVQLDVSGKGDLALSLPVAINGKICEMITLPTAVAQNQYKARKRRRGKKSGRCCKGHRANSYFSPVRT